MTPRLSEHWIDGRLEPAVDSPSPIRGEELPPAGCYSTAKVRAGIACLAKAHVQRLVRDASSLGIGEIDPAAVLDLFSTLGHHAFGAGEGVIRIEARAGPGAAARLRGIPRALGKDRGSWSALLAPFPHRGPSPWLGAKLLGDPLYERARALAQSEGVDEVLLADESGRLVEGARSNLLVVDGEGRLGSPDLALGAVAGVALEAIGRALPELHTLELRVTGLAELRELIAVNAVRGARAIVSLDGRDVGTGEPGLWSAKLDELLSRT